MNEIQAEQIIELMKSLSIQLQGIMIELETGQRRSFDTTDFVIDEFRRLSKLIEQLNAELLKP